MIAISQRPPGPPETFSSLLQTHSDDSPLTPLHLNVSNTVILLTVFYLCCMISWTCNVDTMIGQALVGAGPWSEVKLIGCHCSWWNSLVCVGEGVLIDRACTLFILHPEAREVLPAFGKALRVFWILLKHQGHWRDNGNRQCDVRKQMVCAVTLA